jgi:hypothetical protein
MKLMDVWLAMFSDPQKKEGRFQPELNAAYFIRSSSIAHTTEAGLNVQAEPLSREERGYIGYSQLWLTNIVSASTGLKTLNIDLGFEGGQSHSGTYSSVGSETSRFNRTTWYTGNLRLLGRHVQDTSLVLKYGLFQGKHSALIVDKTRERNEGHVAGADLQIYLLHSLGVEGTGHMFTARETEFEDYAGTYWHANAFVEIAMIRLMWGVYNETWYGTQDASRLETVEHGYHAGLKLQI